MVAKSARMTSLRYRRRRSIDRPAARMVTVCPHREAKPMAPTWEGSAGRDWNWRARVPWKAKRNKIE